MSLDILKNKASITKFHIYDQITNDDASYTIIAIRKCDQFTHRSRTPCHNCSIQLAYFSAKSGHSYCSQGYWREVKIH
jgi:hypothetical protein